MRTLKWFFAGVYPLMADTIPFKSETLAAVLALVGEEVVDVAAGRV